LITDPMRMAMFAWLARLALWRPRSVLAGALVLVGVALWFGASVADHLQPGGFVDPAAESTVAASLLHQRFPNVGPNVVLLVQADVDVDSPAVRAEGRQLTTHLAGESSMYAVTSYWDAGSAALRSRDGYSALIVGQIRGTDSQADRSLNALAARYRGVHGPIRVSIGGPVAIRDQLNDTARGDIARAEAIGIPLTALALILVFRSFIASFLPLLVGAMSLIGTNAALALIGRHTDVSIFSLNLATGLSLGLATDYALFVVQRFREELRRDPDVATAIRATLQTAGRTVVFSAMTVVVTIAAMLMFPLYFLRSFAYAGVSVVVLSALSAVVVLPAALVVLGHRVNALDPTVALRRTRLWPVRARATAVRSTGVSGWRRLADAVMRRPVRFAAASSGVLLLLGVPFLHVSPGLPDDRSLPAGYESHVVQTALQGDFDPSPASAIDVVGYQPGGAIAVGPIADYSARVSSFPGVRRVVGAAGTFVDGHLSQAPDTASAGYAAGDAAYFVVDCDLAYHTSAAQNLVARIREVHAPFQAAVGGRTAELADSRAAVTGRLPAVGGTIVSTTLVLMFLMTGGVLVAIKALVMNVLSLTATFGVLVWIFQDGHLSGVLDFQRTGWVDITLLVLLFCVSFGVSMDYEVFILSRIKEAYARTADNRQAVAYGIEKTGGVVTAAAAVISIVFIAMATSRVVNMKLFGIGLATAILVDAFVVRIFLVPALMRLAGRANWWAPRPLRLLHHRIGLGHGLAAPIAEVADSSATGPVRVD
jgi:RND superfamily putative drug exporter